MTHITQIVSVGVLVVLTAACSSAESRRADDAGRMETTSANRPAAPGSETSHIATAIRERLVQEGTVDSNRVRISEQRGAVYLVGTVDSDNQKARAEQVAVGMPGVTSVVNQLQIASGRSSDMKRMP